VYTQEVKQKKVNSNLIAEKRVRARANIKKANDNEKKRDGNLNRKSVRQKGKQFDRQGRGKKRHLLSLIDKKL